MYARGRLIDTHYEIQGNLGFYLMNKRHKLDCRHLRIMKMEDFCSRPFISGAFKLRGQDRDNEEYWEFLNRDAE